MRSVLVVAVDPGGETGGGDIPLTLVGDGDVFFVVVVGGVGVADEPRRVFEPEDPVEPDLAPEVPLGPALRKLSGVENEGGEGV